MRFYYHTSTFSVTVGTCLFLKPSVSEMKQRVFLFSNVEPPTAPAPIMKHVHSSFIGVRPSLLKQRRIELAVNALVVVAVISTCFTWVKAAGPAIFIPRAIRKCRVRTVAAHVGSSASSVHWMAAVATATITAATGIATAWCLA